MPIATEEQARLRRLALQDMSEARSVRMMGGSLALENETNPICTFECKRCWLGAYYRLYQPWPWCCQQPMAFLGKGRR